MAEIPLRSHNFHLIAGVCSNFLQVQWWRVWLCQTCEIFLIKALFGHIIVHKSSVPVPWKPRISSLVQWIHFHGAFLVYLCMLKSSRCFCGSTVCVNPNSCEELQLRLLIHSDVYDNVDGFWEWLGPSLLATPTTDIPTCSASIFYVLFRPLQFCHKFYLFKIRMFCSTICYSSARNAHYL